jgi:hypothetical protein
VVLAVQAVGAALAFLLALRKDRGAPPTPEISPAVTPQLTPEVAPERAYNRSTAAVTSEPG